MNCCTRSEVDIVVPGTVLDERDGRMNKRLRCTLIRHDTQLVSLARLSASLLLQKLRSSRSCKPQSQHQTSNPLNVWCINLASKNVRIQYWGTCTRCYSYEVDITWSETCTNDIYGHIKYFIFAMWMIPWVLNAVSVRTHTHTHTRTHTRTHTHTPVTEGCYSLRKTAEFTNIMVISTKNCNTMWKQPRQTVNT